MDESEKGKQLVLHLLYRTCQAWTGGEEDSSTHVLVALPVPAITQLLIVDAFFLFHITTVLWNKNLLETPGQLP